MNISRALTEALQDQRARDLLRMSGVLRPLRRLERTEQEPFTIQLAPGVRLVDCDHPSAEVTP